MLPDRTPASPVRAPPTFTFPIAPPEKIVPLPSAVLPMTPPEIVTFPMACPAVSAPEFFPPPPRIPSDESVPIITLPMSNDDSMRPVLSLAAPPMRLPMRDPATVTLPIVPRFAAASTT